MSPPHLHRHTSSADRGVAPLTVALLLNVAYTVVEAAAGLLAGSVALLADAAHNLTDVLALAVALVAAHLALRPSTPERSFGSMRAEILSALFNGVLVAAVAVWVGVEALRRLGDPPSVEGGWLVIVAAAGVAVNVASAVVLAQGARTSLNLRASVVHLASDALASLGVVAAGVLILIGGWNVLDPVVAVTISALVLVGAWTVIRDAAHVLLERAPRGMDVRAIGRRLASEPEVRNVHDLHVWEVTSGFPALSAHVLVSPGSDCHAIRQRLERVLATEFHVEHTTLQVEHAQPDLIQIGR